MPDRLYKPGQGNVVDAIPYDGRKVVDVRIGTSPKAGTSISGVMCTTTITYR